MFDEEFLKPPVLKRTYKAFCSRCGDMSSCVNAERVVVCDICVPFETQKKSSKIILDLYYEYLNKRRKNLTRILKIQKQSVVDI